MTIRLLAKVFVSEVRRLLDQHEHARLAEEAGTIGIKPRVFHDVGHGFQSRVVITRGSRVFQD
jgi:hypothetical protein